MQRCPKNPVITRKDIPNVYPGVVDVTSVFNPGAIKFNNQYLLMLRVQKRSRETLFMMARSENGIDFQVSPEVVKFDGIDQVAEKIYHVYDARITRIEDTYYIMMAMDMDSGCQLGLASTTDFNQFKFLGQVSQEDIRNGVLFPEKIGGKFVRLDRPNKLQLAGGPVSGAGRPTRVPARG